MYISKFFKIKLQTINPNTCSGLQYSLHDAEDLSDHLFHGGGPACVHGLAVALVHGHLGLADRADKGPIPTGEYQERRLHVLHADWALGYQGGGSRSRCFGRVANRIKQVLEHGIQGLFSLKLFSPELFIQLTFNCMFIKNTVDFLFLLCNKDFKLVFVLSFNLVWPFY